MKPGVETVKLSVIRGKIGVMSESRECLWCGDPFSPKVEGQMFCSSTHRHKYRHAKNQKTHEGRCEFTRKICYAALDEAMADKTAANNPALNVYMCRCGSWHWGRHGPNLEESSAS